MIGSQLESSTAAWMVGYATEGTEQVAGRAWLAPAMRTSPISATVVKFFIFDVVILFLELSAC